MLVVKSANQTRTSTTTLADDSELFLDLAAGKLYEFELIFQWQAFSTPGIRYALAFSQDLIWGIGNITGDIAPVDNSSITSGTIIGICYSNTISVGCIENEVVRQFGGTDTFVVPAQVWAHGYMKVGDTAGRFSLQWAQNNSNASGTSVWQNSWIWAEERVAPN